MIMLVLPELINATGGPYTCVNLLPRLHLHMAGGRYGGRVLFPDSRVHLLVRAPQT